MPVESSRARCYSRRFGVCSFNRTPIWSMFTSTDSAERLIPMDLNHASRRYEVSGMSSRQTRSLLHSEAWGISLWATLAFAIGSLVVFWSLQSFVAKDIQRRSDTWLSGEVDVLGDVAGRTPKDRLYDKGRERSCRARQPRGAESETAVLATRVTLSSSCGWG